MFFVMEKDLMDWVSYRVEPCGSVCFSGVTLKKPFGNFPKGKKLNSVTVMSDIGKLQVIDGEVITYLNISYSVKEVK